MEIHMITETILKENLFYDEHTGLFYWTTNRGRVKKGSIAGSKTKHGYLQIRLLNKIYLAHRLAWLYVYQEMPSSLIDHINRNKLDNRICNLRLATKSQNAQNAKTPSTNKSGYKGVSWCNKEKKWRSCIKINQKFISLGYFSEVEKASNAYQQASRELHTHGCGV
jgi:hypothetical protein